MNSTRRSDSLTVAGAMRTIGECTALDMLRDVESTAKNLGWALHRYATNGNAGNSGAWYRGYALHPAGLPRPRRYAQCQGPKFWVNREGKGPGSEFYRSLLWLSKVVLENTETPSRQECAATLAA